MTTLRHRTLNHWRANLTGRFWTDCPVCGRWFGGHEWRHGPNGENLSIPKPDGGGTAICPVCTAEGVGDRAWEKRGIYRVRP